MLLFSDAPHRKKRKNPNEFQGTIEAEEVDINKIPGRIEEIKVEEGQIQEGDIIAISISRHSARAGGTANAANRHQARSTI